MAPATTLVPHYFLGEREAWGHGESTKSTLGWMNCSWYHRPPTGPPEVTEGQSHALPSWHGPTDHTSGATPEHGPWRGGSCTSRGAELLPPHHCMSSGSQACESPMCENMKLIFIIAVQDRELEGEAASVGFAAAVRGALWKTASRQNPRLHLPASLSPGRPHSWNPSFTASWAPTPPRHVQPPEPLGPLTPPSHQVPLQSTSTGVQAGPQEGTKCPCPSSLPHWSQEGRFSLPPAVV